MKSTTINEAAESFAEAIRIPTEYNLVRAARLAGSHWFDADTMRSFGSKLGAIRSTPTRILFISSERDRHGRWGWYGGKRRYTVRAFDGRTVHSVSEFGEFATSAAARRRLERIVADENNQAGN